MSRNDKIIMGIALAVAALLAYEEFFAPAPSSISGVSLTPNALGVPTAAPATLSTAQAGSGLFANPSGLGANASVAQAATAGPLQEIPVTLEQPQYTAAV